MDADRALFLALNGPLYDSESLRRFWALVNSRDADALPAVILLGLYAHYMSAERFRLLWPRVRLGLFMGVYTVLWSQLVIKGLLETHRASPSLVFEQAVRLDGAVAEGLRVKGYSDFSFPGDHAAVGLLVSLMILHFAGRWRGVVAIVSSSVLVLPRLVGGAHWLTDVLVGGGFAAFSGAALLFGTPLGAWISRNANPRSVAGTTAAPVL